MDKAPSGARSLTLDAGSPAWGKLSPPRGSGYPARARRPREGTRGRPRRSLTREAQLPQPSGAALSSGAALPGTQPPSPGAQLHPGGTAAPPPGAALSWTQPHRRAQLSLPGAERIRNARGTPGVGMGLSPAQSPLQGAQLHPGSQPYPRAQSPLHSGDATSPSRGAVPPPSRAQPPLPRCRASGADAASRGGHAGRSGAQPPSLGGPAAAPPDTLRRHGVPLEPHAAPALPPAPRRLHKCGPGGVCPHAAAEPPSASPQPRAAPLRASCQGSHRSAARGCGARAVAWRGPERAPGRAPVRGPTRPPPQPPLQPPPPPSAPAPPPRPRRRPRARRGEGDAATQGVRARAYPEPSRTLPVVRGRPGGRAGAGRKVT